MHPVLFFFLVEVKHGSQLLRFSLIPTPTPRPPPPPLKLCGMRLLDGEGVGVGGSQHE